MFFKSKSKLDFLSDEERKIYALLRYALSKSGIDGNRVEICKTGQEGRYEERRVIVRHSSSDWRVCFVERGQVTTHGAFSKLSIASEFTYSQLVDPDSIWKYRAQWESENGEEF